MNKLQSVLLLSISSLLLLEFASAELLVLSGDNWESEFAKPGKIFIKFYAPWCGHCKKLAPTWDSLATDAETEQAGVRIAKIDCTADNNKGLCKHYGVRGYPTLKLFDGLKEATYAGARSLESLKEYTTTATPDKETTPYVPSAEPPKAEKKPEPTETKIEPKVEPKAEEKVEEKAEAPKQEAPKENTHKAKVPPKHKPQGKPPKSEL